MNVISGGFPFGRRGLRSDDDLEAWEIEEEEAYERERRARKRRTIFTLGLIALLLVTYLLWNRMVVSIESGEAGVQYRYIFGTELNEVYGEGVHVIWPWNRMFIYRVRFQTQQREYRLLTNTGLPVTISVAIRFRPDIRMLPLLHVEVGPNYADTIVFPETEAVLRRTIGQYDPEQVYTSARGFLETVLVGSVSSVARRFVIIDDVLVRSVTLPEPVRVAIEEKSVLDEQRKAYSFRLQIAQREAERLEIEARGIQTYQEILTQSLTPDLLRWHGVQATRELAKSPNAKTVVVGAGNDGLPLILGDR
ncbi:MAG: prohibitin family protein [Pseudomonadota bacterium]